MSAMTGEGIKDLWEAIKRCKSTNPRMEQDRNWIMHYMERLLVDKFRRFCEKRAELRMDTDEGMLNEFIKDWNRK